MLTQAEEPAGLPLRRPIAVRPNAEHYERAPANKEAGKSIGLI
jgi:hypothetical protein